eukprot:scaffold194617_cov21-Prasinocladus_malaysianus.AAC.1
MAPITTYSYPCSQEGVSFPHGAGASLLMVRMRHYVTRINVMEAGRQEPRYHLTLLLPEF